MKHNKLSLMLLIVVAIFMSCNSKQPTKIVCIGDSITEGYGLSEQSKTGWPTVLNKILGKNYEVQNCGRSATTLQKQGDFPYWICKEFSNALLSNPNIVIIKLGTNDTKTHNWNATRFENDYKALVDTIKKLESNPKIVLCTPAPAFKTVWTINDSTITNGVIPIVNKIANQYKLDVIDLHKELENEGANFFDSIHPNELAAKHIAEIIANYIKNLN